MSEYSKLEQLLLNSFKDTKLSTPEKTELKDYFQSLDNDHELLSFTRNKAFEIFRQLINSGSENISSATSWLEKIVKTIDSTRTINASKIPSVYFSPGDACANKIISSIKNAEKDISICVFTISDNSISESILEAYRSGKNVRM